MKKYLLFFTVLVTALVFTTCKKTPEAPTGGNKIEIGQTTVDTVSYIIAQLTTKVIATGGNEISQYGHCWSTDKNPTIDDNKTQRGKLTQPETFSDTLTNLQDNTVYHVRPYITYKNGTVYGEEKTVTMLKKGKPIVKTNSVTDITINSAKCTGTNDDGGLTITARGCCWNTTGNPTLQNNLGYTTEGSGTGSFISNITGLNKNTTYYVAAYATNEEGTAYGQVKNFTTLIIPCGELTISYGGQTYHTVKIGNQCWMKGNLNIGTRINGSQEMSDNGTLEKYCYGDNPANCDAYGGLYPWDEMMQYTTTEGTQGICPDGWHLPSDAEWKTLEMYLGMSQSQADGIGWRGTDEGVKMKSTSGWNNNGNGTNSSGFTAFPGGGRSSSGSFGYLGLGGNWWSSSEGSGAHAWGRGLGYNHDQVGRGNYGKAGGFSVRCIKN